MYFTFRREKLYRVFEFLDQTLYMCSLDYPVTHHLISLTSRHSVLPVETAENLKYHHECISIRSIDKYGTAKLRAILAFLRHMLGKTSRAPWI